MHRYHGSADDTRTRIVKKHKVQHVIKNTFELAIFK